MSRIFFFVALWAAVHPADATILRVVATTSIVGDVVRQIGGDEIYLRDLLPPGSNPHGFEPSPRDAAALADADVVFLNGGRLEASIERVIKNCVPHAHRVQLIQGLDVLHEHSHLGHNQDSENADPHVWMNPLNVIQWTKVIEQTLAALDPDHAEGFSTRASAYRERLKELDEWISTVTASIPRERRKLVLDHDVLGYFADRYGFEQVGFVRPGASTLVQSSARDLAALQRLIKRKGINTILVGPSTGSAVTRRLAEDSGCAVISIYTGSLSESGGPAGTYLDYMRHNVKVIVRSLEGP